MPALHHRNEAVVATAVMICEYLIEANGFCVLEILHKRARSAQTSTAALLYAVAVESVLNGRFPTN